jgi:tetratricopeptide (TPR) repeat protein
MTSPVANPSPSIGTLTFKALRSALADIVDKAHSTTSAIDLLNIVSQWPQAFPLPASVQQWATAFCPTDDAGWVAKIELMSALGETDALPSTAERRAAANGWGINASLALANQLLQQGRATEALASLESETATGPARLNITHMTTVAYQQLGDLPAARTYATEALKMAPDNAQSLLNMGLICASEGDYVAAAHYLDEVLAQHPDHGIALASRAKIDVIEEKPAAAIHRLTRIWDSSKHSHELNGLLISALKQSGRFIEAASAAAQAIKQFRENGIFKALKTDALITGYLPLDLETDVKSLLTDSNVAPTDALAVVSSYYWLHQRPDLALQCFEQQMALAPDNPQHVSDAAFAAALAGDYARAWPWFEARYWPRSGRQHPYQHLPQWDGRPLDTDDVVILHAEQGLGDFIQCIRYLPLLQGLAPNIVFDVPKPALELLAALDNAESATDAPAHLGTLTLQLPMMSLPLLLEDPQDIAFPYLHIDCSYPAVALPQPAQAGDLKVGIVWAGNAEHRNDHNRSSRLMDWAPLASLTGVTFYSLQLGEALSEVATPPDGMSVIDLSGHLGSLADTATLISQLDLVITVDTSVAHLAGALYKPVWMALAYIPDWRWGIADESTRWYPSARLFRQNAPCDWHSVFAAMRQRLIDEGLAHDASTLLPFDASADRAHQAQWRHLARTGQLSLDVLGEHYPTMIADAPWLHAVVAEACLAAGDPETALAQWHNWLNTDADAIHQPDAVARYGLALHDQGQLDTAIGIWRVLVTHFPQSAYLRYLLARSLQRQQQLDEAMDEYREALRLCPRLHLAWNNLAYALEVRGELDEALIAYQSALRYDIGYAMAWQNLSRAVLLCELDDQVAYQVCKHAERLPGTNRSLVLQNTGVALFRLGEHRKALAAFDEVLATKVNDVDAWYNKGLVASDVGRNDIAEDALLKAIALAPTDTKILGALSWHYLSTCNFPKGWHYYRRGGYSLPNLQKPEWIGQSLEGKTLLIYNNQGLGDYIQFARLIKQIPASKKIVVVPRQLERLFTSLAGYDELCQLSIDDIDEIPCDYQVCIMSIQEMLGVDLRVNPVVVPYLAPPADSLADWQSLLPVTSKKRIGIVWAGNPKHSNDKNRSTRLSDWLPLADLQDRIELVSLQKDSASNQALDNPELVLSNYVEACHDFAETAALLKQLDLVIAVDSSVANLAGALGVPTWILIPAQGTDWRWAAGEEDVPWYPSVRLIRQRRKETWRDVFVRLREELVQWSDN